MWASFPAIRRFPTTIQTARLKLRQPSLKDLQPYAAMNADPQVMKFFPATMSFEESRNSLQRLDAHWQHYGFGLYAVELADKPRLVGIVGPQVSQFEAHFTPCVEIAWRLDSRQWNQGLATEAARAVCTAIWRETELTELVALTAAINQPSQRVMQKLGMRHDPADDFDHPSVADDSQLKRHVLYRMSRSGSVSCCGGDDA